MRIQIVGAGPAGLYAAYLLKRAKPHLDIRIVEQNPPDATFGFGVVFSKQALEFLRDDDPETHARIEPYMEQWEDISIVHRGETIVIDGIGFAAIGRLHLIQILAERANEVGLSVDYETAIESLDAMGDADLIIGADGLNSIVRQSDPIGFGEQIASLDNRFAWFGTTQRFDTLTQTFVETADGAFNAHHYRYSPEMSTFIVECDPATWQSAGFASMGDKETQVYCETVFAESLSGRSLVPNNSTWRKFPQLRNRTWHVDNKVLVGDALHTAHFSIGSGTRLALEDVIALVRTLVHYDFDIAEALPAYQAIREPILEKLVQAADTSAAWYERFRDHMSLDPWPFAASYIQRSGRVDANRLSRLAPNFASRLISRGLLSDGDAA